jgi:hypothetical protein
MHLHFVLDEPQYNTLFDMLIEEARARRHTVSIGHRSVERYDADAYIGLQDAALRACPRPRVFLTHGLGLAKRGALMMNVDLLLLPYGEDHGIIVDKARKGPDDRPTTVVRNIGSPKIDLLQRRNTRRIEIQRRLRAQYGFDERPIVGYCPTFRHNGKLHHPQRSHRLREVEALLEGDYNVVMLTHALESDKTELEELRFRMHPGFPRLDHFIGLDCAITDTSGIGFELCAIGMPMVLLDNPAEPDYLLARMLEDRQFIDYGPVCTLQTLAAGVATALTTPEAHAERRDYWAQMAFGPRDGRSAERVIDAIETFLHENREHYRHRRNRPEFLEDYVARRMPRFRAASDWTFDKAGATAAFDGSGRWAFFGPYQQLGAGRFAMEFMADATVPGPFRLQIDTDSGKSVVTDITFENRLHCTLIFEVPEALAGKRFEFRLSQPARMAGAVTIGRMRLHLLGLVPEQAVGEPARTAQPAVDPRIPKLGPAWQEVADFLRPRLAPLDQVMAHNALHPHLPPCRTLEAHNSGKPYDWVVIHKGHMDQMSLAFLQSLPQSATPAFANSVFVIWHARPAPEPVALSGSPHLQIFFRKLEAHPDRVRDLTA